MTEQMPPPDPPAEGPAGEQLPAASGRTAGFWRSRWTLAGGVILVALAAAAVAIVVAATSSSPVHPGSTLGESVSPPAVVTVPATASGEAASSSTPAPASASSSASATASAAATPQATSPLALASLLFPGDNPPDVACGALSAQDFGPYDSCPVVPGLLAILNTRPFGAADEALCRCASPWTAISYTTTNPGIASGQPGYSGVDVVFTFANGTHETLLLIVKQEGSAYLLDDTQCNGQNALSMYQPKPAPCTATG
jgi:hypothetical protein